MTLVAEVMAVKSAAGVLAVFSSKTFRKAQALANMFIEMGILTGQEQAQDAEPLRHYEEKTVDNL